MGYFQVRYDSRVVNYNCRGFIRLATGLVAAIYTVVSFCVILNCNFLNDDESFRRSDSTHFDENRLMWGSDWKTNHSTGSLSICISLSLSFICPQNFPFFLSEYFSFSLCLSLFHTSPSFSLFLFHTISSHTLSPSYITNALLSVSFSLLISLSINVSLSFLHHPVSLFFSFKQYHLSLSFFPFFTPSI